MKPRKTREIARDLERKGFIKSKRDHTFFLLYVENKKTSIFTKISHGKKEYDSYLLGRMAKNLRISNSQFIDLLDCPLSREEYVNILVRNKDIII